MFSFDNMFLVKVTEYKEERLPRVRPGHRATNTFRPQGNQCVDDTNL